MHFLIYTNKQKDPELKVTYHIKKYLEDRDCRVTLYIKESDWKAKASEEGVPLKQSEDYDSMLVLGGDGTVLWAVRDARQIKIPLIGVNLGTLGFLAQIELSNLEESLDKLIARKYQLEERMMLSGEVEGRKMEALNDIVIARSGPLQIVKLNIYVNGQFLYEYKADGVLITTPTGSTGYNLSAGGPLIEPKARLLMMTPICPHRLNQRSIIFSPEDCIEIEVSEGKSGIEPRVSAAFDGVEFATLCSGQRIAIRQAKESVSFIQLNQISFLETLHKKMNE